MVAASGVTEREPLVRAVGNLIAGVRLTVAKMPATNLNDAW